MSFPENESYSTEKESVVEKGYRVDDGFNLTSSQQDVWMMDQIIGDGAAVITGSVVYQTNDRPSIDFLNSVLTQIVNRNDSMRLSFGLNNDLPVQYFRSNDTVSISFYDFNNEDEFLSFAREEACKPLDSDSKLYAFYGFCYPGTWGLIVRIHHLLGDAWSLSFLVNQINQALHMEEATVYPYYNHLLADKQYHESDRYKKDLLYFETAYQNSEISKLYDPQNERDYHAKRLSFTLTPDVASALQSILNKSNATIFSSIFLFISILLSKKNNCESSCCIGTTVLNRYGNKDKNTTGMFVNTLPVYLNIDYNDTLIDNLHITQERITETMRHAHCSYSDIYKHISENGYINPTFFDVSINYQISTIDMQSDFPCRTIWFPGNKQSEALSIHFEDRDMTGNLNFHYDFRTTCLNDKEVYQFHSDLCQIIINAAKKPDDPLFKLSTMSDEELKRLLGNTSNTPWPFIPGNLGAWFHNLAETAPETVVLETKEGMFSYKQLDDLSNRAAEMMLRSARKGDTVALLLSRKKVLPIFMIAAMKAGLVFLLVDPEYPQERIDYMLKDSHAALQIDDQIADYYLSNGLPEINLSNVFLDDRCYYIYTSGTTGNPKGVIINQKSIANNIFWRLKAYPEREHRIINVTNVTADTFLEDVFYALYSGNRLCLVEDRRDIADIRSMVGEERINDIMTTPTFFSVISKHIPINRFKNVTLVGEQLDSTLANELISNGIILHNEYGPSECTVCATHAVINSNDIHIGKPIDNTTIYILDPYLQVVPTNVKGEICIGGIAVGQGYLGLPELTEEKFVSTEIMGRIYKTGDIGYWREDGNICICGRADHQVKIHGQRIELDEIENVMSSISGIERYAVIVSKSTDGEQMLCAYYSGKKFDDGYIKHELSKLLPRHMVPSTIIYLQEMPINSSGKIDRKKLPSIDSYLSDIQSDIELPTTWEQKRLCEIAQNVLKLSKIGINNNFFLLGGDSLKAIDFVSQANRDGIPCKLQMLFDHPTIKELTEDMNAENEKHVVYRQEDLAEIQKMIICNNKREVSVRPNCMDQVLLTGATGFLGNHILASFIDNYDGTIWCIVRGLDIDNSTNRLQEKLHFYWGPRYDKYIGNRIRVITGDLIKKHFGVPNDTYELLEKSIDTVIHTASNVRHFGEYEKFYQINVKAVIDLLSFCSAGKARLIHCSTTSILDSVEGNNIYTEEDFYHGQNLDNVYLHSKFEAEKHILIANTHGTHHRILRLGNITNRFSDGVFQDNYNSNAFVSRIKSFIDLKLFPEELSAIKVDFTPVDLLAESVLKICSLSDDCGMIFHLFNPGKINLDELVLQIKKHGFSITKVNNDVFIKRMKESSSARSAFINDFTSDGKWLIHEEHISANKTLQILSQLGFTWPEINSCYLDKYISYFKKIRFWEE